MSSAAKQAKPKVSLEGGSSVFAADLDKDEDLLWQSRPGAWSYAFAYMRAVLMGLTLLVVAIAWNMIVTRNHMMPQLAMVGWMFGALGALYVLLPISAYVKAKWFLFYGLTKQRLLILQLFPKRRLTSFPIKTVNRVVAHNVHLGNGTVLIDAPGALSKNPIHPRAGFYGVPYATKVQEAIETLKDPEAALKRIQAQKRAAS
jgi:hypothetical protein